MKEENKGENTTHGVVGGEMIQFILLVNKQGQTRVSKYYTSYQHPKDRVSFETEIVRRCLLRADDQVRNQAGTNDDWKSQVPFKVWFCGAPGS